MLHLKNGTYINWQTLEFSQTDIWAEEGENGKIHFSQPGNIPGKIQSIDCTGLYITRALANAH
ncbi:MAG: hypothetical protein EA393_16345, partial [Bacteroidetes bacterium]